MTTPTAPLTPHLPASRCALGALLLFALATLGPAAHAQTLLHTLTSPNPEPNAGFGATVADVGDLDGDGRSDLFIGAPGESPGPSPVGSGRAHVYSGATGGLLYTLASPSEEEAGGFGFPVAGVPDLDGDGVPDLLVGARGEDGTPNPIYSGRAHVYSGATGAHLHTLASPNQEPDGRFGDTVAGVPDLDGDGRGDLIVGARYEDAGGLTNAGQAYLFSGATGALLRELASPNEEESGFFGSSLTGTADLNGDGRGDLLVGASFESPGTSPPAAGRAYVFSGATGALLHTLTSIDEHNNGSFGAAVDAVPDTDGDGIPDLLVSAPGESDDDHLSRVYVFSGATGALRYVIEPPEPPAGGGGFGIAVAGVPDLDGDGRGDLIASNSEQRQVYGFSGASGRPLFMVPPLNPVYPHSGFGWSLAGSDDLDGDGRGDLLVGTLFGEEAYVYSGAPGPVALSATALTGTVPQGGRLRVQVSATNPGPALLFGDLKLRAVGPGGVTGGAVLAREIQLPADVTATRSFRVRVPVGAPVGVYQATVEALAGGVAVVGTASFSFVVTEGAAREDGEGEDTVLTWDAPVAEAAAAARSVSDVERQAVVAPNPASDEATVTFALDAPSEVRVALYDVLGREVAVAAPGVLGAGSHRAGLDVAGLPAGVYVWRLAGGDRVETGRLTVAR